MKHLAAETLVRNSISRVSPNPITGTLRTSELQLPPKLGTHFLSPDNVSEIQNRYDRQSLGSAWYGYSLVDTPPARVVAVIAFTSFGDRDHLIIARDEDDIYALAFDAKTVFATSRQISRLLDLFDEHTLCR
jgi:hypothetical protein